MPTGWSREVNIQYECVWDHSRSVWSLNLDCFCDSSHLDAVHSRCMDHVFCNPSWQPTSKGLEEHDNLWNRCSLNNIAFNPYLSWLAMLLCGERNRLQVNLPLEALDLYRYMREWHEDMIRKNIKLKSTIHNKNSIHDPSLKQWSPLNSRPTYSVYATTGPFKDSKGASTPGFCIRRQVFRCMKWTLLTLSQSETWMIQTLNGSTIMSNHPSCLFDLRNFWVWDGFTPVRLFTAKLSISHHPQQFLEEVSYNGTIIRYVLDSAIEDCSDASADSVPST